MRTYLSPIGYDTRRVTRPIVNTGISGDDTVQLLRPKQESDTEQASQAVADVRQLLQEIEPGVDCVVTKITPNPFEEAVRECCELFTTVPDGHDTIVSLGGGPRDILLPLTISSIVFQRQLDQTLFFSDLDGDLHEWALPTLTAQVPQRTVGTFEAIATAGDWISLSALTDRTDQSKSTIIRHVNDLEETGVIESDTSEKTKRVRISFSGELLQMANSLHS